MLIDMKCNEPKGDSTFEALQDSPIAFHQTGSRHMGGAKPTSDWDFIAQHDPKTKLFLASLGFTEMLDDFGYNEESNSLTVNVMQMRSEQGHVVQVQLARDLRVKVKVRDIIRDHLFGEHLIANKSQRADIWNSVGAAVEAALHPERYDLTDIAF